MPTRWSSRFVLVTLGALALVASACSSSPATPGAAGRSTTTTTTGATTTTESHFATSTTAPPATTSSTSGAVQNLAVTPAIRATLTTVYVNEKQLQPSDISGTEPNSVYYAYDPSTATYWAMATFMPSSTASQQVLVGMQDGGNQGLYKMPSGGSWSVSQGGYPPYCGEQHYFPPAVMAVWNMATAPAGLQQC